MSTNMLRNKLCILKVPITNIIISNSYCSTLPTLTRIEFNNNIRDIIMCDEKTRNSLSVAMLSSITKNINKDENDKDLRAIVISSTGNIFSGGHNLKEMAAGGRKVQEEVFKKCSELMSAIIDSPVPVIAKVDGLAAAAGCQLVAQCDLVICSDRSSFSTPGANFGIFCSTPGIALARTVNRKAALHMLLTGLPITAQEAQNCGLVSKICASENLDQEVEKVCNAIKAKSRNVIELGKRFFYQQIQVSDLKKAYDLGGDKMVENCQLPDGQEGMKSFSEKRKPHWMMP